MVDRNAVADATLLTRTVPVTASALLPMVAPPMAREVDAPPVMTFAPSVVQPEMPPNDPAALYWIVPDAPPGGPPEAALPPPPSAATPLPMDVTNVVVLDAVMPARYVFEPMFKLTHELAKIGMPLLAVTVTDELPSAA